MKKSLIFAAILLGIIFVGIVTAAEATVCCEKTKSGLYCQNVPEDECSSSGRSAPSSCNSVDYCREGTCYNEDDGICLDNTPQRVCNANNGLWSNSPLPQCNLGCCVLGDQAAFVSLVRCKKLSGFLGLQTNFKKDIEDEVQCVMSVRNQDRGACVYSFDYETTCKFTTRDECNAGINSTAGLKGDFFVGKLCSAPELGKNGSICGMTKQTTCIPGKDEVYFQDSCGNPGNIYDSSKINDVDYWTNIKDKSQTCNANSNNANSASCGNCNYLLGTICSTGDRTARINYGNQICKDLNCKNTQNGNSYKHGESWCVFNDEGKTGLGKDSVGSRFYKHICVNGQEILEQCADFRQEECIQDTIKTTVGDFSQAACRVNRWQDCILQTEQKDCENTDKRDCYWKTGIKLGNSNMTENAACLPKNPTGLKFWEGEDAKTVCNVGSANCIVTYEKSLFGDWECAKNCECLTTDWQDQRAGICSNIGDCGPNVNWIGQLGYKPGFKITESKVKSKD